MRELLRDMIGLDAKVTAERPTILSAIFSVQAPRSHRSDSFEDHRLQHLLVHISELLDVEAALAGRVLAELREQRLGVAESGHAVQNICGLARRKTDQRHIALTPALVFVVVAAEANN